jgi:3-oxoacyl-[acyl-carrier protein] reductase
VQLDGRVAVVTGGGGGLGGASAEELASEGATVVVVDRDLDAAEAVAERCRATTPASRAARLDVSDSAAVRVLFDEVVARHGRIDVLVTAAGISSAADVAAAPADRHSGTATASGSGSTPPPYALDIGAITDDAWHRMLAVHLDGTFFCVRSVVPVMAASGRGSIVCFSSIAGLAGMGPLPYSAAKGGILGLVRSLARVVGPAGVRVNAVCPGAIDAGMTLNYPKEMTDGFAAQVPLGRLGTAREIGQAVVYLASDASSYTTGQWLSPNGGIVIG